MDSGSPISGEDMDTRIINLLQEHPRASYTTIARLMGASDTTVRRRMNALFEQGRLRMMALPDPARVGFPFSAIVYIRTTHGGARTIAEKLSSHWQTTYVSELIGAWSISCIVRERSLEDLAIFLHETVERIPGVEEVEAQVVAKVHKGWGQWRIPEGAAVMPRTPDTEGGAIG
ncbi:MAG TPA: Lrp/AsnC family transcriptional regulator [Thermomicrobiales bacterium]|nr:Lrp/AsnC family transcriptional regulator [Thermomicrobiales bacterium]